MKMAIVHDYLCGMGGLNAYSNIFARNSKRQIPIPWHIIQIVPCLISKGGKYVQHG